MNIPDKDKEVALITIQYLDGTHEVLSKGLVAYMPDAESVLVRTKGLEVPTLLTLIAALEEAARKYLKE